MFKEGDRVLYQSVLLEDEAPRLATINKISKNRVLYRIVYDKYFEGEDRNKTILVFPSELVKVNISPVVYGIKLPNV